MPRRPRDEEEPEKVANIADDMTQDDIDALLSAAAAETQPEPDSVAEAAAQAPTTDPVALALQSIAQTQAMMVQMMGQLMARADSGDGQATALAKILAPALERMAESNLAGAKLVTAEQRRTHRPSNEFPHLRSVFNRRGVLLDDQYPEGHAGPEGIDPIKPKLKCLMMLPWLAEWESMTREEVELLNLLQPGTYMVKRVDNSKVQVTVNTEFKVDGVTPTRLLVNHETAYNNDNQRLWPSIADWCRQVLRQHDQTTARLASAVMSDEEEEALIEAGDLVVSK